MTTEEQARRAHPSAPNYYTVEEVAERFRVSGMTVLRLIRAGELYAGKVGRSWRITRESVEAIEAKIAGAQNRARALTEEIPEGAARLRSQIVESVTDGDLELGKAMERAATDLAAAEDITVSEAVDLIRQAVAEGKGRHPSDLRVEGS